MRWNACWEITQTSFQCIPGKIGSHDRWHFKSTRTSVQTRKQTEKSLMGINYWWLETLHAHMQLLHVSGCCVVGCCFHSLTEHSCQPRELQPPSAWRTAGLMILFQGKWLMSDLNVMIFVTSCSCEIKSLKGSYRHQIYRQSQDWAHCMQSGCNIWPLCALKLMSIIL